jgi:maltose O-acetyltransferase
MTDIRPMYDRMIAGDPYLADDPRITAEADRAHRLTHRINTGDPTERERMRSLFVELLGHFGQGSVIRPPFHCDYGTHTSVGAGTFANFGLVVLDVATVTIGDHVQIGPHVQLLTATHPLDADARRAGWESAEPIVIEDNVWLGGGVVVCPGVTIGRDTVVGAGSVVVHDLPAGVLAVGSPARVVRELGATRSAAD